LGDFELKTNVDYSHRGRTNIAAITDPGQWERPVGLLDARITLSPAAGSWQIALIGKNLTNELYSTYGTEAPSNPLVRLRNTERPRQIAVEVGFKY
jgi:iron complex outermembrane recepter protein